MIGAHLDSWHGGTGATDNAAGSAVMIEVMRILKALNLRLDRTVRLGLWSGEEQGLLGSRAYVTEHFAGPRRHEAEARSRASSRATSTSTTASGKIRGVYLQGNDAMRPVFEAWFKPFADLGAGTISFASTGGTDHLSFDAVGLPGFQFIQDPLEYDSRTHHSNMDVYDRVQRGRHDADGRDRRVVRVQRGESRRAAAAQAAAEASATAAFPDGRSRARDACSRRALTSPM